MILTYAHSCNELDCKFRNFTLNEKWFQNVPSKGQRYHSSGCRARRKKKYIFRLTTEKEKSIFTQLVLHWGAIIQHVEHIKYGSLWFSEVHIWLGCHRHSEWNTVYNFGGSFLNFTSPWVQGWVLSVLPLPSRIRIFLKNWVYYLRSWQKWVSQEAIFFLSKSTIKLQHGMNALTVQV